MKKKILAFLLVAVMTMTAAFAFTACGSDAPADTHPADTFYNGSLSEETYASSDEAAKAFVAVEINGEATDAKFVSYTKVADLTDEETDELSIPAAEKTNIESVEKGEIKYTVSSSGTLTSADGENVYVVFIVTYKDKTVKYYAPALAIGDPLTKSYYDSVFDPDNFKNVTVSYTLNTTVTCKIQGQSFPIKLKATLDYAANDKTYSYAKVVTTMDTGDLGAMAGLPSTTVTVEEFTVNNSASPLYDYSFTRTYSAGETAEWIVSSTPEDKESPWYDVEESSTNITNYLPEFDYSYFIKTKTGFKINSEKFTKYCDIALKDAMNSFNGLFSGATVSVNNATANFYVYEGKLTDSKQTLKCSYTLQIQPGVSATYVLSQTSTMVYTDYGTTVVNVPDDLDLDSFAADN